MKLNGKVTIITGASGGIGKSVAQKVLEEGSKVVLVSRNKNKLKKTVEELGKNDNLIHMAADVSHESEVLSVIEQTLTAFDKIDNLINCAAIINDPTPFHLMTEDQWTNLMNVNLKGTFQPIKAVIPLMIEQKSGNIINISSLLGIRAIPKVPFSVYGVTKAGIIMLTKSIAVEYGQYNIRCNCIAPSTIRSPMMEPYLQDENAKRMLEGSFPLKRIGDPEDVANAILFLASDDSKWITGTVMTLDGGISAKL
ncbi:Levodione reductase [Candidatus Nitrosocosmicus oleophilus]|jgi:NAD(P)-dependent dehydrogenase (short-subunit alcohol dehydrogenase family)|uniref:Levodione reductase n=1 Tax=Candidatus Nitrosocosmicus oleophilus TaxID=1353260 RepID=A0A654LUJ0_9ARCH|nr:SDR family oxidoreductase [Candidatus Nitrosocosmicus oleophilus]ALI34855.1 Levodione reductase [Candidatus Nitrosocosmicus oleophilus]HKQ22646.1 SDR family oxidoreductase [Nitrososphaeraceae archaeon]